MKKCHFQNINIYDYIYIYIDEEKFNTLNKKNDTLKTLYFSKKRSFESHVRWTLIFDLIYWNRVSNTNTFKIRYTFKTEIMCEYIIFSS